MTRKLDKTLQDLEAELAEKVRQLHEELAPLEAELADTRRLLAALKERNRTVHFEQTEFSPMIADEKTGRYRDLTMKELTLKALNDHFMPQGATAQQLLAFFRDAYNRHDVTRSSLSPQLTRLKREGRITREGQVWRRTLELDPPPEGDGPEATAVESVREDDLLSIGPPQLPDRNPG